MGTHRTVEEIVKSKTKTTLYLPSELSDKVKQLAIKNRRSFNNEIVVAIEEYIKKYG